MSNAEKVYTQTWSHPRFFLWVKYCRVERENKRIPRSFESWLKG